MKFQVSRDVLAEAVAWTARSLSSRPPIPILASLLITAREGEVAISSFDYEISSRLSFAADVEEEGTLLVSARIMTEICAALPQDTVDVTLEGTKLNLRCRKSKFVLSTMPLDEYPQLPATPDVVGTMSAKDFVESIQQVGIAASKDDNVPILTTVKLEFEPSTITMMATDRYRLGMKELEWKSTLENTSVLVKAKTLTEVARQLGNSGQINVALSEKGDLIAFESAGRWITSSLIDGDYPAMRTIIPSNTTVHAVVNTQELLEAVKRVSLVAERSSPIRLMFSENQLVLDAGVDDDASATEVLACSMDGENLTVGFNPLYLREGLSAVNSPKVRFAFSDSARAALLIGLTEGKDGEDKDDSTYRYLVMPVRLS